MKTKFSRTFLMLALVAAIVMSVTGGTIAWFTDEVSSANNVITSGNLDMLVQYKTNWDDEWANLDEETKLFKEGAFYEPGYTETVFLRVANAGNLAFKYRLSLSVEDTDIGKSVLDNDIKLSDYLEVGIYHQDEYRDGFNYADILMPVMFSTREDALKNVSSMTKLNVQDDNGLIMLANDCPVLAGDKTAQVIALVLTMPTTVGNEANHNGTDVPSIEFGLSVVATQFTSEEDSFDNQYDADAEYPVDVDQWDGTADTSWYNDTDTEFMIMTAEQLAGFAELVDGGNTFAGKTVKLGMDIDLMNLPFNPIGHSSNGKSFNGMFDGQGHTISNMYMQSDLGAWQYEGEYYGLFAYTNGATIKNVTVADAYISSGRNEAAGVVGNAVDTSFENISIKGTTLIAYNNSAGGVAAECYGNCSFKDITVDEETVIGPLWGTYDVRLGGVVGMVKSSDKVSFSNINVACKLDAINDVAANYQYWLYRYCGMLIGQVDGVNGVADPTGYVTCENVTVTYGDWVNYHYCEFESLGAGSYNGPGDYKYARVEAGTGTDGIDLSTCNHDADESHNVLIVFDQLFGGGQGVSGLKTYDGVTVNYPKD